MKLGVDTLLIQETFITMRLKREYKVGTPIWFKWYYNEDRYTNPNAQFVIKEGVVDSNTFMNEVIIHTPQEDAYYCVSTSDIV